MFKCQFRFGDNKCTVSTFFFAMALFKKMQIKATGVFKGIFFTTKNIGYIHVYQKKGKKWVIYLRFSSFF